MKYQISEFNLAQLRHLYQQLLLKGEAEIANNLLAPIIRQIEEDHE